MIRKVAAIVSVLMALAWSTPASGQNISGISPLSTSATLSVQYSSACATTSCVTLNLGGYSGAAIQVRGTWSGTLTPVLTTDGTVANSVGVQVYPSDSSTPQTTITANGLYFVPTAGGRLTVQYTTKSSGSPIITVTGTAFSAKSFGGAGGGGGGGGVSSVALSLPNIFTVSGSPVTSAGTLTGSLATQTANRIFAGPTSGGASTPTFRVPVSADFPASLSFTTPDIGAATGASLSLTGVSSAAGFFAGYVTKTGTYTATAADSTIECLTNAFTVNLPTAAGITGRIYTIKNLQTANTCTVDPSGSETIDGSGTVGVANGALVVQSDGTNWRSIGSLGVGLSAIAQGDLFYGSAANVLSALTKDANATRYLSNTGTSNNPAWAQVNVANGITGTTPVANGGTGLTSGTSGGILGFTASGVLASSGALTANLPVIGGGAGVAPTVGTRSGNTTAYVTTTGSQTSGDCVSIDASGNHVAAGAACGGAQNTFTSVPVAGQTTVTANSTTTALTLVAGSGVTLTTDNTAKSVTIASSGSGGVSGPGSSTNTALALWNGTGGATLQDSKLTFTGPASTLKTFTLPNATATILTDNAAVTVAQGGSGAATLTGILKGNGTSPFTAVTAPTGNLVGDGQANTYTTGAQDMSSATSWKMPVSAGAAPTANGAQAFDSTAGCVAVGGAGTIKGCVPRIVSLQVSTTDTIDASVVNTTETAFTNKFTIPANYLVAGRCLKTTVGLLVTTSASSVPTIQMKLRVGGVAGTVVFTSNAGGNSTNFTTQGETFAEMVCGTAAAGASVNTVTSNIINPPFLVARNVTSQPVAWATNAAQDLVWTVTYSSNTAGNTITQGTLVVEEVVSP